MYLSHGNTTSQDDAGKTIGLFRDEQDETGSFIQGKQGPARRPTRTTPGWGMLHAGCV